MFLISEEHVDVSHLEEEVVGGSSLLHHLIVLQRRCGRDGEWENDFWNVN